MNNLVNLNYFAIFVLSKVTKKNEWKNKKPVN